MVKFVLKDIIALKVLQLQLCAHLAHLIQIQEVNLQQTAFFALPVHLIVNMDRLAVNHVGNLLLQSRDHFSALVLAKTEITQQKTHLVVANLDLTFILLKVLVKGSQVQELIAFQLFTIFVRKALLEVQLVPVSVLMIVKKSVLQATVHETLFQVCAHAKQAKKLFKLTKFVIKIVEANQWFHLCRQLVVNLH